MRYKFVKTDMLEEMEAATGRLPRTVLQAGDDMVLEFDGELSPIAESSLEEAMRARGLKLVEKGELVEVTEEEAQPEEP